MTKRADMVREARRLVEVPFQEGGRTARGVDCCGLHVLCCRRLGLGHADADPATYPRYGGPEIAERMAECCDEVAVGDRLPGHWVTFWIARELKQVQHAGILTDGKFVHAWAHAKKVVESAMNRWWEARIYRVFRHRELED